MDIKSQLVDEQFSKFNCSQTVLSLFAPELGIDEKTALRIASGFGGGMACAETCGAVTGAYMVIGLKHGHSTPNSDEKAATKTKIKQFNEEFLKHHNSLKCKELLGVDISGMDGAEQASDKGLYKTHCPRFIKTACTILEERF